LTNYFSKKSRIGALSSLTASEIVAKLLVKGETYSTTNQLHVKTCISNELKLGQDLQCILTNKRMILIDTDDDVVNTISGSYSGRYPKSNNLSLLSHNYFSILFIPFRLIDVTDLAVNFRYGSEKEKVMKRGWPKWALITIFLFLLSFSLTAASIDPILSLLCFTSFLIIPLMLFFPYRSSYSSSIYVSKKRELSITVVNSYTKHVQELILDIQDAQSIESVLAWISTLQSLSSATSN